MAGQFRGLTVEARRGRTGLLLGALGPADGDLLGVRAPRADGSVTGRGLLVVRGRTTPVQVAHSPL
jgi:S-DNA-T family DNA segregation ATPase FtsK/SpoIIIE